MAANGFHVSIRRESKQDVALCGILFFAEHPRGASARFANLNKIFKSIEP